MKLLLWLLVLSAVVLLVLYVRERVINRSIHKELQYVSEKLDAIMSKPISLAGERLFIVTGDPVLRELLRAVNDLLDRARKSAADYAGTERAMRMMLSNVSHDLKTPLTVILGYAEMLQRKDMPQEEQQRLLAQIHRKTVEVHNLIKAFFDLARLEADDYDITFSKVEVGELCRHRLLSYYELLAQRHVEVDIQLSSEPVWIYSNEEALSRIIDNLLSNAVRYGADGGYLGLSAAIVNDSVQIKVTDRGRGIDPTEQDRIFERMYTVEHSRNRKIQGSGLGLSIVKQLTHRLGGQIQLSSIPNSYTCFTVTIPISSMPGPEVRNK